MSVLLRRRARQSEKKEIREEEKEWRMCRGGVDYVVMLRANAWMGFGETVLFHFPLSDPDPLTCSVRVTAADSYQ